MLASFHLNATKKIRAALENPNSTPQPVFLDEIEKLRTRVAELEELLSRLSPVPAEDVFSGLLDHTPYLVHLMGPDGRLTYGNRLWQETFGYREEALRELFFTDLLGREDLPAWKDLFQELVRTEQPKHLRLNLRSRTGRLVAVEGHFTPVMRGGALVRINAVYRSLEEIKRTADEREQFFLYSLDMLAIIGFDGYFKRINPAFERVLGYTAGELFGRPVLRFVHRDDRRLVREEMRRLAEGTPSANFEHRFKCRDGSFRWLAWTGHPEVDEARVYAVARDITAKKQVETELRRLSVTDELTRLYNRRGFVTFTEKLMALAGREGKGVLITLADIDRMKEINDRYGHAEGDRAIVRTAEILRKAFRGTDVIARLGGDEFAVSAVVAQRGDEAVLRQRLRRLAEDATVRDPRPYPLCFSVGFAYLTPEDSLEEALDRADQALYEEKRNR